MSKLIRSMRKPAFTIIELIIAISIVVILAAVAVPRYNGFNRNQEFKRDVLSIANCIQDAQQAAGSPASGERSRYSSVKITQQDGVVSCSYYVHKDQSIEYLLSDAASPQREAIEVSEMSIGSIIFGLSNQDFSCSATNDLKIYFGVIEKGAPIAVKCGEQIIAPKDSGVVADAEVTWGGGFTMNMILSNFESDIEIDNQQIVMQRLGLPIEVKSTP